MRSRKHTAWKKSRKLGDIHGGRNQPKLTDGIFRRLHSLRPPPQGADTPMLIQDNPSRDFHFPLDAEACLAALQALPREHYEDITHVWLRRPSGVDRRRGLPDAEFVCGGSVRLIVLYPWRNDRRACLGRRRPAQRRTKEFARFGGTVFQQNGEWFVEFSPEGLRQYVAYVLYHEVGHHLDAYRRRWSKANRKPCEDAADHYAVQLSLGAAASLGSSP